MAHACILLLSFFGLLLSVPHSAAPGGRTDIAEAYLAKDNGKGEAGEESVEFETDDIPIYCVVMLDSDDIATVRMELIAVDVSGVKAESKVFNVSYTTRRGENRVNFEGRPVGKWTPGKYRIDLFVNGKREEELPFRVNGEPPTRVRHQGRPNS
jgi:hypothetical protein